MVMMFLPYFFNLKINSDDFYNPVNILKHIESCILKG